jgi:pectate lyase
MLDDSIAQVMENITSFAPSLLRQNAAGNIEVVPLYGTDAFADPVITLEESDIVAPLYEPKPDPRDSINAAEVRFKGLEFEVGQELFTPAEFVFAYDDRHDDDFSLPSAGFTIPEFQNYSDNTPPNGIILQQGRLAPFDGDIILPVPALDATLVGGSEIFVDLQLDMYRSSGSQSTPTLIVEGTDVLTSEYQQVTLTADANATDTELTVVGITYALGAGRKIYFKNQAVELTSSASIGATTLDVEALTQDLLSGDIGETSRKTIPTTGFENANISPSYKFAFLGGGIANDGFVQLIGRYDKESNALIFTVGERTMGGTAADSGLVTTLWFHFQMRFYGKKYTVSNTEVTAKFGFNDTDKLTAPDQTDTALEKSRALVGRRSITVTSQYLTIPLEDAQEYAQAIVRHNINPTKLWTINLTYAGMTRAADYDSIGQLGALPNLVQGIWNRVDYSDAKEYRSFDINEVITLKEFERIYDDEPTTGVTYVLDEFDIPVDEEDGNGFVWEEYVVAADGTPTTPPLPADPQPTLPSDIEGFAGVSNSTDWTNATVVTVGTLADLKTQAQIDGTAVTPRIVRLTMNITAGGAGDSAFPTTGDYVTIDLNGFTLLGGSAVPDYEDNVSPSNYHPNGFLFGNYSGIINGTLGHFYDGVRLRNSKTGCRVENIRFKYCQDEQVDLFGDAAGNPTSRHSLINCTFEAHPTDPTQFSHAVLLQSDSYTMTNTYLTMARCRFEDGISNRMPLNKSGANVHIYGNLHFDSQSGSGHIGIGGGAEVLAERNVFYDNSTGNGKRVFYLTEGGGAVSAPLNYYMNQAVAGLTSTAATRLASIPYAYTLNTTRVDVENAAGSSY